MYRFGGWSVVMEVSGVLFLAIKRCDNHSESSSCRKKLALFTCGISI